MRQLIKYSIYLFVCGLVLASITSCGSFGQGMLMGLAQTASMYGSSYPARTRPNTTPQVAMTPTPNWNTANFNTVDWSQVPVTDGNFVQESTFDSGVSTGTSSSSSTNSSSSSTSSGRKCVWCNGTGKITKNDNAPATFGLDKAKKQCSTCGEWFDPSVVNHYHISCSHCGGTGIAK